MIYNDNDLKCVDLGDYIYHNHIVNNADNDNLSDEHNGQCSTTDKCNDKNNIIMSIPNTIMKIPIFPAVLMVLIMNESVGNNDGNVMNFCPNYCLRIPASIVYRQLKYSNTELH